jgi:translation initiation factor 2B subunit (eIF-2B alpha/beta/delta family)
MLKSFGYTDKMSEHISYRLEKHHKIIKIFSNQAHQQATIATFHQGWALTEVITDSKNHFQNTLNAKCSSSSAATG